MSDEWGPPEKGRLEAWWEQRPLWVRGVLIASALGGVQLVWMLDGGLAWWESTLLVVYVLSYPFAYVRGKLHPPAPMESAKKIRMRRLGSWGAGLSIGVLLSVLGALAGPTGLLVGVLSGTAMGAAVGWLVWTVSR